MSVQKHKMKLQKLKIFVCIDSQVVIKAPVSPHITYFKISMELHPMTSQPCPANRVTIVWRQGYRDIDGNEKAFAIASVHSVIDKS